jgi:hypothetical protein
MKCEDAAEFVSALCDGEAVPQEAAEHLGGCQPCQTRLYAYSAIGAEMRRLASLEERGEPKAGSWENEHRTKVRWWHIGKASMRIPRFAFVLMLAVILLLSGGLVLVRARASAGGPVLVLTIHVPPDGRPSRCTITTDENPVTNHCTYGTDVLSNVLTLNIRFVRKAGERTELGVKTRYDAQERVQGISHSDRLKDLPEETVWIDPGNEQAISVPGLGTLALTGEYLDHIPTLQFRPDETLDPQANEFRIVSPVLIRGKEVVFNRGGSSSIDSGDRESALILYLPGEGRYLISTVPFEGAVQGNVELGQIKFRLEGQEYLLLTAMPTTRSEHVWVTHDPQYKLSEHMQGASDGREMFMVRSLTSLQQDQIHH